MCASVPLGQAKLFEAALACRYDLPSLDPNRYLQAAIAYGADNSALRRHQHFVCSLVGRAPLDEMSVDIAAFAPPCSISIAT